ncbi:MAG: FAD-dependent monooxygenase, partial [Ferruginibacter sp.]|nr:FAD-dependent monooxygenase [Ferruginibacter sp.]
MNNSADFTTNVLIVGAGPAGASTSIFLAKEKIPHIIIDKAVFPRDKICGDALSAKSVDILNRLNPNWTDHFLADKNKSLACNGIQFIGSDNTALDIPFAGEGKQAKPTGFVSKRIDFDEQLVNLLDQQYANLATDTSLKDIEETKDGMLVTVMQNGQQKKILAKLVLGAEGRGSIVAKKLAGHTMDAAHFSAGIRGYYKNVSGMHEKNFIELHFLKEFQPGYLWIFPLPNGQANVGVGMLSKHISNKKVNLKQLMLDVIATHPELKKRFTHAVIDGSIEGWGLPL